MRVQHRLLLLATLSVTSALLVVDAPRPVMAEFLGVNGHTVQFKPVWWVTDP